MIRAKDGELKKKLSGYAKKERYLLVWALSNFYSTVLLLSELKKKPLKIQGLDSSSK